MERTPGSDEWLEKQEEELRQRGIDLPELMQIKNRPTWGERNE